ncbi:MAG: hypothetical protein UW84_C0049G0005 [Candidatus Collierbacteria bacterium GW2011_GWA2_44_99]|uniref:GDP-mannose 4,6-dehydratase n=1 Tax=Candidatus Collierbacteria bacterium GW2011_GWA2_44_99 TaxID=1618380 RepID=A0A0G1MVI9_9BACT|nr:MAG: hypothetical protein UW84_C0049G0005 [Candidatus Collierbacteria bacterium GW2011_GWA2_44_99]
MAKQKTAVIVGVTSQDGSYLAELLLSKGYKVVGTIRRTTSMVHENIEHLKGKIILETADLIDPESLNKVMIAHQPDEVYNIASQSVPGDAWTHPFYTGEVTALGPVRVQSLRYRQGLCSHDGRLLPPVLRYVRLCRYSF